MVLIARSSNEIQYFTTVQFNKFVLRMLSSRVALMLASSYQPRFWLWYHNLVGSHREKHFIQKILVWSSLFNAPALFITKKTAFHFKCVFPWYLQALMLIFLEKPWWSCQFTNWVFQDCSKNSNITAQYHLTKSKTWCKMHSLWWWKIRSIEETLLHWTHNVSDQPYS